MCKFSNRFEIVIILLYVVEGFIWDLPDQRDPAGCLHKKEGVTRNVCTTNSCKRIARYMLEKMDFSVDPCENFYLYACGKYLKRKETVLPNLYSAISTHADGNVTQILQEPETPTDSELVQTMKKAKEGCISGRTVRYFQTVLEEFGGVPMFLKNWTEKSFSWPKIYEVALKYGYEPNDMFSITVDGDTNDNTRRMIYIEYPKVYNTQAYEAFTILNLKRLMGDQFIYDVAKAFGWKMDSSNTDMCQMLNFAAEIDKVADLGSGTGYYRRNISDLNSTCPSVPWLDIINAVIGPVKFTNTDQVILRCVKCLSRIHPILERTPKRVIANYLLFNFILENIYYLEHSTRDKLITKMSTSLRNICQDLQLKYFYMLVDHIYVSRFYNQNYTKIARSMFDNIVAELKHTLQQTHLFETPEQKKWATEKLEAMIGKFGVNDDRVLSYEQLEEYYKGAYFTTPKQYYWEMRGLLLREKYNSLKNVGRLSEYLRASAMAGTYYPHMNTLHVSAADLIDLITDDGPQYFNYGIMGYLIGHEITHGYGLTGIHYGKNGDFKFFYDEYTNEQLGKSETCISNQFDKYQFPFTNLNVSGQKVADECISDNGGIYLSYHAYRNLSNVNAEEFLPGLENLQPKQMFWLSYATSFCDKYDPKDVNFLLANPHPVPYLRVYVGLQNFKEFAEDFQCKSGSTMNPKQKCSFWNV